MAKLTPPNWAPHAVPSVNGWHHPITGELLSSGRHVQEDVDAFFNKEEESTPTVLTEAPVSHKSYDDFNETEKEAISETSGLSGVLGTLFERK
jgi:hypothetical protein